jgi:hypothetical protein
MSIEKMVTWKLLLTTLGLFLLSVASFAAVEGIYTAKVSLPSSVSGGGLEYKLELKSRSEATLEIKRASRLRLDRSSIEMYGDQLTFLESPDRVNLTGRWSETEDGVRVDFNKIRSTEDTDFRDVRVELYADGQGYRVDSWDPSFFGQTNQPRFVRANRGSGNDLVRGLAIVAAGALIVKSTSGSSSSADFRYETGGSGNARFGNGDRTNLDRMKIDFRRGGSGTIMLDGSYEVELRGSWKTVSNGFSFKVLEVRVAGQEWADASGNLTVVRDRNANKRIAFIAGSIRFESNERRTGSLSFNSSKG